MLVTNEALIIPPTFLGIVQDPIATNQDDEQPFSHLSIKSVMRIVDYLLFGSILWNISQYVQAVLHLG